MNDQELIDNAPLFDHFSLIRQFHDDPTTWEWILLDIFSFSGGDQPGGWLISDHFKLILEQFIIAQPHRFYPAKLLYKGNKLDYSIFNLLWTAIESTVQIDALTFNVTDVDTETDKGPLQERFHSAEEIHNRQHALRMQQRLRMHLSSITINQYYDLIPLFGLFADVIISERLKIAIEQSRIEGVDIKECPYEVIMPPMNL
ncbi:hypothetical protein [Paraflavitalea pollutisoli]|uniref:hypothetical protein n=1 Tax=Paraflavitalea pollutisoli TaxID=3034143 RepID=UPI0023EB7CF0|nr:hypothetical protein [Paraflavitalea sp. H1-2-19X]